MLKKFRKWYHNLFLKSNQVFREQQIAVKNHIVEIKDAKYFIGKAMVTDIPELLKIEKSVYDGQTPWNYTTMLKELKREQDRLYLVIRYHDQLVAFIGCAMFDTKRECHITNLAVQKEFQHRGLAYYLMTVIIKKARLINYDQITLEVRSSNYRAQHLYSDLGFYRTGIKNNYYVDNQEDAIDMALDISEMDSRPNNYGL
ncbi:ribosomal protein S18-alanine N-acetyltransferase [Nicoliella spurrieriana]|uniref:Ribosomal protein S18-alanine N-acetyltransferase n=1 Tax=Nicoliella spurrieriana TaxID=2925830 RepID=A0A976RSI9_9LACO|nr:ribosomal protein S18-alanine N-acetyltransferase [Nicoliella spurrieriana]UQS86994.1 ribosomal protein S18-alanine N-acetyltransferase [Nicoliella spurrieriana]